MGRYILTASSLCGMKRDGDGFMITSNGKNVDLWNAENSVKMVG